METASSPTRQRSSSSSPSNELSEGRRGEGGELDVPAPADEKEVGRERTERGLLDVPLTGGTPGVSERRCAEVIAGMRKDRRHIVGQLRARAEGARRCGQRHLLRDAGTAPRPISPGQNRTIAVARRLFPPELQYARQALPRAGIAHDRKRAAALEVRFMHFVTSTD